MSYQYGQGFEKDLKSLFKLVKKEGSSIDFDGEFVATEIQKIIKYNKPKEDQISSTQISDELSHELENRIDLVMDKIQDESIKTELRSIRDAIPCSCGNEDES